MKQLQDAYIIDALRTPVGRYGGALSSVRADDLGAVPLRALMARHQDLDWSRVDDVIYGCANQAGEDNRDVARMSSLLAGLSAEVPGCTLNRLCGSGMDAVGSAARALRTGEANLINDVFDGRFSDLMSATCAEHHEIPLHLRSGFCFTARLVRHEQSAAGPRMHLKSSELFLATVTLIANCN